MDNIIESVYVKICQGMLEKHKLLFAFYICTALEKSKSLIREDEWILFLRGITNTTNNSNNNHSNTHTNNNNDSTKIDLEGYSWMTRTLYTSACLLEDYFTNNNNNDNSNNNPFADLSTSLVRNADVWKNWMESEEPYNHPLPREWKNSNDNQLTGFQKMILIRCLRYIIITFQIII